MNVNELSKNDLTMLGIERMPVSLNEALQIAKRSELVEELLGKNLKDSYIAKKETEYDLYRRTISKWELDRYLVQY